MLKKTKKTKRNPQKTLAVLLALANSIHTTAPLTLPLAAIIPEMPKARQGTVDELLATCFNRGGQLLDRLFFSTAYAETVDPANSPKDVSTGTVDGDIIINGGTQNVFNTGRATNATVNSGGRQNVSNGGAATDTVINDGGEQRVHSGGSAVGTTVSTGGLQYVFSNATATSTTVAGGTQNVYGSAANTTVDNNMQGVFSGGIATNTTVNNGGYQYVYSSGTATGTTVNSGGLQNVLAGGTASGTIVNSSGTQYVDGIASNTTIDSGGRQNVYSGGIASGTIVSNGGQQNVFSSGTASGTIVSSGGTQEVAGYGTVTGAAINEGGNQLLYGSASNTVVNYLGRQDIFSGGRDTGSIINSGGWQHVSSGGAATGTTISGGTQYISVGGIVSAAKVLNSGQQYVENGGTAIGTIISSGGQQDVDSGGNTSGTVVSSGGTQFVNSGGTATSTTVYRNGAQTVFSGGAAFSTIVDGGRQELAGSAYGITIINAGRQNVGSGAFAGSTTIDSGTQFVYIGGSAANTTVNSGGTQHVSGGSASGTVIHDGGTQHVSSGTATNTTIHNGGIQAVWRGVIVSNTTVNSGGMINLVEDGASLQGDTTLNQGTIQIFGLVDGVCEVSRLVVNSGGIVKLAAGAAVGNRLNIDDLQGAANFVINTDLAKGKSDKLEIKNAANASGSTLQVAYDPGFVNNSGTSISGTAEFATVAAGDASFTALPTDYGAYRFTPTVSSATDAGGTHWSVTGLTDGNNPDPGGNPGNLGVSETMLTASDVITNNLTLWRSENSSLMRRMGELRNDSGKAGEWVRIYRGETETTSPGSRYTKATYTAIQGGYDKKHENYKGGTLYTGYTVGYLDASVGFNRGGGDVSNLTVGAYSSWLGDKGHFLDIIAKQGRLKNSYHNYLINPDNTKVTGSYHNWGSSLSAEYGFRQAQKNGWYLEPQAEISFSRVSSADYTASDGTRAHNSSLNSTVGRLGLAIGKTIPACSFYAKASIAKEFSANTKVTMSTGSLAPVTMEQDLKEFWLEFALGLNGPIGKNTNGYLEISKTTGDTVKTSWLVNAGLRMSF